MKAWLDDNGACRGAREWVGRRGPKEAWRECQRGDWMLWALARTGLDRKRLVRICVDVALGVLHLSDDPRVGHCIDVTEAWCDGLATDAQLVEARDASAAAARAADAAAAAEAAAEAAYAATDAAYTATDAAYAATDAAYAASAAYAAAAEAAYAAAEAEAAYAAATATRREALADSADLVRRHVTADEFEGLVKT